MPINNIGKQNIVGICCEHSRLSLTWMVNGNVKKSVFVDVPDNIAEGSEIVSTHLFASLLRDTLKANYITCKQAAFSLPYNNTFFQMVTLPEMDDEQIRINIPFEFRDFIPGELSEYVFAWTRIYTDQEKEEEEKAKAKAKDKAKGKDKAKPKAKGKDRDYDDYDTVEEQGPGAEPKEKTIRLAATAVERSYLRTIQETFEQAGLNLVYASTEVVSFRRIGCVSPFELDHESERAFMDIGRDRIRMFIFKDKHFKLMHGVEIGERRIVQTIADEMMVDEHIARTYYETNYQECWDLPAVVNIYKDISIEILKAINFYEVSDFTARLTDVVLSGGGSIVEPLVNLLKARLNMNVRTIGEIFPEWDDGNLGITAPSLGIAIASAMDESLPMNLIQLKKKSVNTRFVIPVAAGIVVGAVLFGKFAVFDRLNAVYHYDHQVSALQDQIAKNEEIIKENEELSEQYYHYTWSGMTAEEALSYSRVDIANLIHSIANRETIIHSYSVTDNEVFIDLNIPTLKKLSQLARVLEKNEMVDSCTVQSAQTDTRTNEFGEQVSDGTIHAQILIYLALREEDQDE